MPFKVSNLLINLQFIYSYSQVPSSNLGYSGTKRVALPEPEEAGRAQSSTGYN